MTFEINGWRVEAGAAGRGSLGCVALASGAAVDVPCVVVNGAADGPTLLVTAATHGQEIVGTGAAIELVRALDPARVRGRVVVVPVVNPLALQAATYVSPLDGLNMAGPLYRDANPHGTISERIGALIEPLFELPDYYIDIHGNSGPCAAMVMMFMEHCRDAPTRDATARMANAVGLTAVDMSGGKAHPRTLGDPAGYPVPTALARGVPAVMVELTAATTLADRQRGARGVLNVMLEFDMLDGTPEPRDPDALDGSFAYWGALNATTGGLMWTRSEPGTLLAPGDLLLEVTNLYGDIIEEVRSPVAGFSWWYPGSAYGMGIQAVPEGAMVALIAEQSAD